MKYFVENNVYEYYQPKFAHTLYTYQRLFFINIFEFIVHEFHWI